MFEDLRLKAGTWYARMHFRSAKDPILHFNDVLSSARNALILLPETTQGGAAVRIVVKQLRQKFQTGSITLVSPRWSAAPFAGDQGSTLVTYSAEDLTIWFVPRVELLRKVKKSTFDVAIDLNLGFSLPSAFLCRASQAPVRVSFTKPHADEFYNFQVKAAPALSLQQAYAMLIKCMEMF